MRPTARGWVTAAAVVLSIAAGAAFGSRGLNAFAAPGVVALVAAAWQLHRFDPPTAERDLPERGQQGTSVRGRIHLETATPMRARVREAVSAGLVTADADQRFVVGETPLEYDLQLDARGEQSVGPMTVTVYDVLGLLGRTFTYPSRTTVLVHPRVSRLSGTRADELAWLHGGTADDRQAFDALRRYQRGDPLRDVHWKSSAKQPDGEFVVKQFAVERGSRTVDIAASAAPGTADAMAEAAASVAVSLLDAGVRIRLATPEGRVESSDPLGRDAVLDHLARVGAGRAPDAREADVVVDATPSGVRVEVGDRSLPFSSLVGSPRGSPAVAVGVAE